MLTSVEESGKPPALHVSLLVSFCCVCLALSLTCLSISTFSDYSDYSLLKEKIYIQVQMNIPSVLRATPASIINGSAHKQQYGSQNVGVLFKKNTLAFACVLLLLICWHLQKCSAEFFPLTRINNLNNLVLIGSWNLRISCFPVASDTWKKSRKFI